MVTTATLIRLCIGAVFGFALPIGLLIWWRRTRHAKLTPFFAGALVFVVFVMVLEQLLHTVVLYGDSALAHAVNANPYLYMLYGGLAAGVFEETGRYVAFRWLIGRKRFPERDTAVTYGIGHGGMETMLMLGVSYVTYVAIAVLYLRGDHVTALMLAGGNPAELSSTLGTLGQITTGGVLLAVLERVGAIVLHIALSCFVFLAARDKTQWTWFPFAILLHAIVDMPAALYQRGMLPLGATEIWVWVVALYALRSARKCYLEAMDP